MLVLAACHIGYRLQILAYKLSQNSISLAVKYSHTRHSHEYSVVDEVLHSVQSLVATHSPHVKVLMEVQLVRVNSLACLSAYAKCGWLRSLWSLYCMLQARSLNLCANIACAR